MLGLPTKVNTPVGHRTLPANDPKTAISPTRVAKSDAVIAQTGPSDAGSPSPELATLADLLTALPAPDRARIIASLPQEENPPHIRQGGWQEPQQGTTSGMGRPPALRSLFNAHKYLALDQIKQGFRIIGWDPKTVLRIYAAAESWGANLRFYTERMPLRSDVEIWEEATASMP